MSIKRAAAWVVVIGVSTLFISILLLLAGLDLHLIPAALLAVAALIFVARIFVWTIHVLEEPRS